MKRKLLFILPAILILVVSSYLVITYVRKETPLSVIHSAREMIATAEHQESLAYSKVLFRQASIYYDSAMVYWQIENQKWFFQRDFKKSIKCAELSEKYAVEAISRTKKSSKEIKSLLSKKIEELTSTVKHFESAYNKVPLTSTLRKEWAQGRILLEEGILAYKNSNYLKSVEKLDSASVLIKKVYSYPEHILEQYFSSLSIWRDAEEEFIKRSRKEKKVFLVVDKYNRELKVYKNGTLQTTYEVDLGPNWIGDKSYQGDKATPEGEYKILKKKEEKDTKYYKALLLNYPNDDDKARFEESQKEGLIEAKTKIGGLIEIHGNGGKGVDWTEGCVAMKDKDIDKLFAACNVGTEVLIVGALSPLKKLEL